MGVGTGPIQANLNGRIFWDQARGKLVIKDEDGTQRFLASAESIKLSQSGFDVETATDSQLVFSSEFNLFKIVMKGTYSDSNSYSVSNPGVGNYDSDSFTIATIPHNLGYRPGFIVYATGGTGDVLLPSSILIGGGSSNAAWHSKYAYVDDTNLYINLTIMTTGGSSSSTGTVVYKYYLLRETTD